MCKFAKKKIQNVKTHLYICENQFPKRVVRMRMKPQVIIQVKLFWLYGNENKSYMYSCQCVTQR